MKKHGGLASAMSGLVLVVAVAMAAPARAQGEGEKPMTPEQKAQMEAWMKAMTPGKQHAEMATKTGVWEGTASMWDAPGAAPQVSQAHSERKMGLGGRVLIDHWTSTMMGMPFEGMGMNGYDNASGKHWSTWTDNFSTGVMTSTGNCDADPKRGCSYNSTYVDPMTGKEKKNRIVVSWPAADQERMEMFDTAKDGKEFRTMEIVLKRVKP